MSDQTGAALRVRSHNRLTDVAEILVGALMPADDEPHSWLVHVGRPTGPDPLQTTGPDRWRTVDRPGHLAVAPVSSPRSPDGTAPPLVESIGILPLDSIIDCPLDALTGLVAPDDWWALGVAATAQARRIDRPEQPGTPVLVVLLVDRAGQAVSLVPRLDGRGSYEQVDVTAGPEGILLDLCRRAFGLSTAPPEQPPMTWWAQLWLDAVLRDAAAEPCRPWTWPVLMARHPLCDLVRPTDTGHPGDGGVGLGPDRFARAVEVVVAGYDWERLRQAALAGPNREVAAWMDEGCFARWTLGTNPEVPDLLAALPSLLSAEAVRSVQAVLGRWGLGT